jgi:hypothetical protein
MGRLAGLYIQRNDALSSPTTTSTASNSPLNAKNEESAATTTAAWIIKQNVAGDCLRPPQIARTYGRAQSSKVRFKNTHRTITKWAKEHNPELFEQIHLLRTNKERTDIDALQNLFGSQYITTFADFLEETNWEDRQRTFEDLSDVHILGLL